MFDLVPQFLLCRYGSLAEDLSVGAMNLTTTEFSLPSGRHWLPTVVLKGKPHQRLRSPNPQVHVFGVETPECPVVLVGVHFPLHDDFGQPYVTLIPMHSAEQRSLLRIIATAPYWFYVFFSGAAPTLAFLAGCEPGLVEAYSRIWTLVAGYPLNPNANTQWAIQFASEALAHVRPQATVAFLAAGFPGKAVGQGGLDLGSPPAPA